MVCCTSAWRKLLLKAYPEMDWQVERNGCVKLQEGEPQLVRGRHMCGPRTGNVTGNRAACWRFHRGVVLLVFSSVAIES